MNMQMSEHRRSDGSNGKKDFQNVFGGDLDKQCEFAIKIYSSRTTNSRSYGVI